jgi:thymidylate kinase
MSKNIFIIEGLDRLGKSTLIQGIRDELGYYEVIHFNKPQRLAIYDGKATTEGEVNKLQSFYYYQYTSFENMMLLMRSNANIIFDRAHLGEVVYSPLYRNYSGDYVFELEKQYSIGDLETVRLILLVEDFDKAKHFVDDGNSLGPTEKRFEEQERFISAFHRSLIKDKRIICVTDTTFGGFKNKKDILKEALV